MVSKTFYISLFLCFFLIVKLRAQSPFLDYYKNINLAELAICDSQFAKASAYYKNAFAINPEKPFSKDLLNAFFAAMDTKQYAAAEKYLSRLLARGLGSRYISKRILKPYGGEQLQQIQAMLKKYPNDTLRKSPLADTILKMLEWDQEVRAYYSKLNDGAYMTDSTFTVDSINGARLLQLFKKHGVPNEDVLGNSRWSDFSVAAAPDYDIVILHHNAGALGGRPAHLLDTLLYKAVLSMDYNAHRFAFIVSYNASSDLFQYGNTKLFFPLFIEGLYYKGKIYPEYFNEASEKRMNEQRAKIGLESLDDFRRKIEASNAGKNENSVLHKYFFTPSTRVDDVFDEASVKKWLAVHGKDAPHKKSIQNFTTRKPVQQTFDYGNLGDRYVIGKSQFDSFISRYQYRFNKEYYQWQVAYGNWKTRKLPLPWNYHAEVIANDHENLQSDAGRYNRARFIPGYRMLVEYGQGYPSIGHFSNIEMWFDKNVLMQFSANVDTTFYRAVTRRVAPPPSVKTKHDTVSCSFGKEMNVVLSTRTYTWKKDGIKMEVILTDTINDKCRIKREAVFYMTDEKKYQAYLKKVAAEKARLDNEYVGKTSLHSNR